MKSQRNQFLKINTSPKKMISNYTIINMSKSKAKIMMIKIMNFQVCLKKTQKKRAKFKNAIYVTLSTPGLQPNVELIMHSTPNLELTSDQQV